MSDPTVNTEKIRSVIADALQLRRASTNATRGFVPLRHNADLCPGVEHRLSAVLEGISKRIAVVADIQGVNDHGVDVLVTLETDEGRRYIAIQIKSEPEARDAALLRTLKAGYFDALNRYGGANQEDLLDYYVFLGWDARANLDRTRLVSAELATARHVRVVPPISAWAFFAGGSRAAVDAIVTASASDVDPLLGEARALTRGLPHGALAALLVVIANWTTHAESPATRLQLEQSLFWRNVRDGAAMVDEYELPRVEAWMKLPEVQVSFSLTRTEQLALDLDSIDDVIVFEGEFLRCLVRQVTPLAALAYDAYARFGHRGDSLAAFLYDLLTTQGASVDDQKQLASSFVDMINASRTPYEAMAPTLAQLLELNCQDVVADLDADELHSFAESQFASP